ncbi:MAG: histidine kinase [Lachnospiraceae bacterium]|nr:histidine kinase [Lachnospiraceae bacterium]MBR3824655.1 histidine kinase [Lachnospiraceae bacterium]MBR4059403.1 histidine kinase [Lachnospiraceae bacterium]MBR4084337.1 histidine kinase [Lachnospiraceae bacterium]MBR6664366.1 histidine kinase [Lachnospiraceae bacterium]
METQTSNSLFGFLKNSTIQNHQFKKMFIRNWGLIFMYMVIPLAVFIGIIWFFSQKSLLKEVDMAAERSTNGTIATINSLFEEAHNILDKIVMDEEIYNFFCEEYTLPLPYSFVSTSTKALEIIKKENREYLYYSVDVYSDISKYIVSTQIHGTHYQRLYDKGIVDDFFNYVGSYPNLGVFAIPRQYRIKDTSPQRVITIYRSRILTGGKRAFVSMSMDVEKMCGYIVDEKDYVRQRYLLVDNENNVIMDTAGSLDNTQFQLPKKSSDAITMEVENQKLRVFYKEIDYFDWNCVQLVPIEEIQRSSIWLRNLGIVLVITATVVAAFLSYKATTKLFKPIEAILHLVENPSRDFLVQDEKGEIQYLLLSILEMFEKNMVLEQEMIERVTALRRARAKALQEQMTPHFLSNVLQAINWIAMDETQGEESKTCQSIVLLADIICAGKSQTTNITTVADEMEYIKKFFELEQLRFGPNIHFYYNITSRAEDVPIPCISLQTLVENAIIHGLQPKGASGNIYVFIKDTVDGGLIIRVEDDGVGMPQDKIDNVWEMMKEEYVYLGEHFGIVNLFQRFRLIYGEGCRFAIYRSSYGGTCVEIVTPKLPEYWITNSNNRNKK